VPDSNGGSGRFTVTLPKAIVARLDALAAERGTRRAILMREAAFLYLKHQGGERTAGVAS
jgi:predicted transcriptional regulator